jgi:integrase
VGGGPDDYRRPEAVVGGHQLFLDEMEHKLSLSAKSPVPGRHPTRRGRLHPTEPHSRTPPRYGPIRPVTHRQLTLFDQPRQLIRDGHPVSIPDPPGRELAEALEAAAIEHGRAHGWAAPIITTVRRSLRILLGIQDTPGAPILASQARCLRQLPTTTAYGPTMELLAAVGMLDDDRIPTIVTWFDRKTEGLPAGILAELQVWLDVMRSGSLVTPRRRPRGDRTIRNHLSWALPTLRRWAVVHDSLREVTREEVQTVLRASGPKYIDTLAGLRSIFRVLKVRKLVFVNPTARIRTSRHQQQIPLPVTVDTLHDALDSPDPARAALACLLIFHGLRPRQLRQLQLTDIRDGRLFVDGLVIPLAPPAAARIRSYLDFRAKRWPATCNPHMFVNKTTANRTSEASYVWVNRTLGLAAQRLRDDRILDEIRATGGDLRRISDMFGIEITPASRYLAILNHPDLDTDPAKPVCSR